MKPDLSDGLLKAEIVHTVPSALVYGLLCYSGLNILNLHSKQLLSQLIMLIQHGQSSQDTTSILIQAIAKALKLESGIQGEFSEILLLYQDLVTNTWLKQIRVQCKQLDICIATSLPNFHPL